MMPLDKHYDYGFGATGDAFFEAAKTLEKNSSPASAFLEALPRGFLLRHALELYLKSAILIIHKLLDIPFGDKPSSSPPRVLVGKNWEPFFRVHSIADLYSYWKSLVETHAKALLEKMKRKPDLTIPVELDADIELIEKTDPQGTYYRYPANLDPHQNKQKSPFKDLTKEVLTTGLPTDKPLRALLIEDANNELLSAFVLDETTDKKSLAALWRATDWFHGFHAMSRIELTGGK